MKTLAFFVALVYPAALWQNGATVRWFDPHNHVNGVLPYYAYADLPAFTKNIAHSGPAVGLPALQAYYDYLAGTWYPSQQQALDDKLYSPQQRYAIGARASLQLFKTSAAKDPVILRGALERILTATPWSEFDSAYAFRGGPTFTYLSSTSPYKNQPAKLSSDICNATVLDLAQTGIGVSEQSMSFIGGWNLTNGVSDRLNTIRCYMQAARDRDVAASLAHMQKAMPIVKFVLMTHTSQLASSAGGDTYNDWSSSGTCTMRDLPASLKTTPQTIYRALLGEDASSASILSEGERPEFFNTVIGIDTASMETTCFTASGMQYYGELIAAVYNASKARRALGWHGKLLVHTHVGEGGVIYFAPSAPQNWTFASIFGKLPSTRTDGAQARINISMLLGAIERFERAHPDAHRYVVFRMAHVTWATDAQAKRMHDDRIEADVNLESNVATDAYPISRMPLGTKDILKRYVDRIVGNVDTNFRLNNLIGVLIPNSNDAGRVGAILGSASLQFLARHRVRYMLGTDADGVEHSGIANEYRLADALLRFWRIAPNNAAAYDNVRRHLEDMSTDEPVQY